MAIALKLSPYRIPSSFRDFLSFCTWCAGRFTFIAYSVWNGQFPAFLYLCIERVWARYIKQALHIRKNMENQGLPKIANPATNPCMENAIWSQLVPRTCLEASVHISSWLCIAAIFAATVDTDSSLQGYRETGIQEYMDTGMRVALGPIHKTGLEY